jgi:hypothetical protein
MSKSIVIKSAIVLAVAALVYSAFWFFKVGQVEKQIKNFISENAAQVSAAEVSVSGFPMSQKITVKDLKFSLPTSVFGKRQVLVKTLEAKAGIFSTDFVVTMSEGVSLQDAENNNFTVEFSKDPEVSFSIADDRISAFSYQDSGYRIFDAEKNIIYAASSSNLSAQSSADESEKVVTKITANIKDIENFDVLDVYKNSFEKKIAEGIKTGEIVVNNNAVADIANSLVPSADPAAVAPSVVTSVGANPIQVAAQPDLKLNSTNTGNPVNSVASANSSVVAASVPAAVTSQSDTSAVAPTPAVVAVQKPEDLAAAVANNNLIKSNLIVDIEYVLAPIQKDAQIPTDPTKISEVSTQHSKSIKINNLEFSNPLYKIMINGEMTAFQDDNMPSGSVSVKVEKIDTLINYIIAGFGKIIEQKIPAPTDIAQPKTLDISDNAMPTEDSYRNFLNKMIINMSAVTKELAAKNAVSKEEVAVFDIRREKNLEFLINETSIREILGKF